MSKADFDNLELMTCHHPGEKWGLTKDEITTGYLQSKDSDYRQRLKDARRQFPMKSVAKESKKEQPGSSERLKSLESYAKQLLHESTPYAHRLPLMRVKAIELSLPVRDQELQKFLWNARRDAAGAKEPLVPGDVLKLLPYPWCLTGVVMASAFNLLVALPKIGKTSLVLAMISAWHHGERSFLGKELIGPCPPVLIVGTDQPLQDWARMLQEVSLLGEGNTIRPPLVALFWQGSPLYLDPEGIERISEYAAKHPNLLVVLDSIAACTSSLGLNENSVEIAGPVNDLMEAIEPHGATLIAIHHCGKGSSGESPATASRGSTAIPALASQIISLMRFDNESNGQHDRRIVLKSDGRGGQPQDLLIERTDTGWISHGSSGEVARARHLRRVEDGLNSRQREALDLVRQQWEEGRKTDAATLAQLLGIPQDGERKALRTLDQLTRHDLLRSTSEIDHRGRHKRFWPVASGEDRSPPRVQASEVSDLSVVSEPSCRKGSDTKDTKDTQDNTPRAHAREALAKPLPEPASRLDHPA